MSLVFGIAKNLPQLGERGSGMKSYFFGEQVKKNSVTLRVDWHSALDYMMIAISVCALVIYS